MVWRRQKIQPLLSFIEPIIVLTFMLRVLRFIYLFIFFSLFICFTKILNSRHVYYRKGANFSKSRTSSFSSAFSLCKWVEFDLLVYCWYFIASYKNRLMFKKCEKEKKKRQKQRQWFIGNEPPRKSQPLNGFVNWIVQLVSSKYKLHDLACWKLNPPWMIINWPMKCRNLQWKSECCFHSQDSGNNFLIKFVRNFSSKC